MSDNRSAAGDLEWIVGNDVRIILIMCIGNQFLQLQDRFIGLIHIIGLCMKRYTASQLGPAASRRRGTSGWSVQATNSGCPLVYAGTVA